MKSSKGQLISVVTIGVRPHEGETRDLVLGLKYAHEKRYARELAGIVAPYLAETADRRCVLTWAPTTAAHRLDRGMDHAEVIARHAGALSRIPVRNLLRRISKESQTGKGRSERLAYPEFISRPLRRDLHVFVIDDVVTTGATFRAAATALVNAGAQLVTCVAPSRTV